MNDFDITGNMEIGMCQMMAFQTTTNNESAKDMDVNKYWSPYGLPQLEQHSYRLIRIKVPGIIKYK